MITLADAERIREAFGPCSLVYECMSLREIVESVEDDCDGDVTAWIRIELDIQDIHDERWLGTIEDDNLHGTVLQETRELKAEIRNRLKEAGFPCDN